MEAQSLLIRIRRRRESGWILLEAALSITLLLGLGFYMMTAVREGSLAVRTSKNVTVATEWLENYAEAVKAGTYGGNGIISVPFSTPGLIGGAQTRTATVQINRTLASGTAQTKLSATMTTSGASTNVAGGVQWTYTMSLSFNTPRMGGGTSTMNIQRQVTRIFPN